MYLAPSIRDLEYYGGKSGSAARRAGTHPPTFRLGFHVSKNGRDMATALLEDTVAAGVRCAQIFAVGPRKVTTRLSPRDLAEIREKVTGAGIELVFHGSYFDHPWDLNAEKLHLYHHIIRDEMRAAYAAGAAGVIVHLSRHTLGDPAEVLRRIARGLADDILDSVVLFVETNSTKPGPSSYETPEKLNTVMRAITRDHPIKIGLCIDTAHLHACGVALDSAEVAREWLGAIEWSGPLMFHLNDNVGGLGSGRDIHADIGKGDLFVGGAANGGLQEILRFAAGRGSMVIIERDDPIPDVKLVRGMGY